MILSAFLTLDNAQFQRAAISSRSQIGALAGGIGRTIAPLAALGAGFLSVAAVWQSFKRSIGGAAEFEDFEASFVTLLGSVDAAEGRLAELEQFGKTTPFELPGVVKASKILQSLTQGTLATSAGLTLVGDVAANANQPIEELAVHVGRLYDGLKTGRAVGESLQRLQELGIISGETRTEIEELQKSGAAGAQVWGVAEKALGRFSGEMARRSGTWNGMMSNFKDGVDAAFRAFGAPIVDELKPVLADAIAQTDDLAASGERFGNHVAYAIRMLRGAASENGLGTLFAMSLLLAGANFINQVALGWNGIVRGAIGALKAGFSGILETFKYGMLSLADAWAAIILGAIEDGLKSVGLNKAAKGVGNARKRAESSAVDNAELAQFSAESIIPLMLAAFENGIADADGFKLIDTDSIMADLKGLAGYYEGLIAPAVKTPESSPQSPAESTQSAIGGIQAIAADRLARIGGFVGGTGPATDHARRTSDNTRKTSQLLAKTNSYLARMADRTNTAGTSAWA